MTKDGARYTLSAGHSGQCLAVDDSDGGLSCGAQVIQTACDQPYHQWYLQRVDLPAQKSLNTTIQASQSAGGNRQNFLSEVETAQLAEAMGEADETIVE